MASFALYSTREAAVLLEYDEATLEISGLSWSNLSKKIICARVSYYYMPLIDRWIAPGAMGEESLPDGYFLSYQSSKFGEILQLPDGLMYLIG